MDDKQILRLKKLIEDHCTREMIHAFLKGKKSDDSEVKRTGKKTELVDFLFDSYGRGKTSTDEITRLLAVGEEHGRQHILLYHVPHALPTHELVANSLFGKNWRKEKIIPNFQIQPKGFEWGDLRSEPGGGWTLKAYYGSEIRKFVSRSPIKDGQYNVTYRIEPTREVLVVKYSPKSSLLEVRIPIDADSDPKIQERLTMIWDKVKPAVKRDSLREINLRLALNGIVQSSKSDKNRLRMLLAKYNNLKSGWVTFEAADDEDTIWDSSDNANAIKQYNDCWNISVEWLLAEFKDPALPDRLRTEIGVLFGNHIRIGKSTSPEAVSYVIEYLRGLAGKVSAA